MLLDDTIFNQYVEKSLIVDNYASLTPDQIKTNKFINCSDIDNFYSDALFYLHLYSALYVDLSIYNTDNNFNIENFKTKIENLSITIDYSTYNASISSVNASDGSRISTYSSSSTSAFTFYSSNFKEKYNNSTNNTYNSSSIATNANLHNHMKPVLANISTTTISLPITSSLATYTKINLPSVGSYSSTYASNRENRVKDVIKEILSQSYDTILSYLSYQAGYYNIIVLNTSIQRTIYDNYLNSIINLKQEGYFISNSTAITTVNNHIGNMKANLDTLKTNKETNNSNFIEDKQVYYNKIQKLNNINIEYRNNQDYLNNTINSYNQYYKNYNSLKFYSSLIIIFLLALIVISVSITFLPNISPSSKNTYFILLLIILVVLTVLYYNRFRHVNLYEKFVSNCPTTINYSLTGRTEENNNTRVNHFKFFNDISGKLKEYLNSYNVFDNVLGASLYTVSNETYTTESNKYLNSIYIERKRKIELYRIKRIEYINLIEAIKKQVIYLFNIIFILMLFIIILLLAMVLYSTMPFAINQIIGFISVLILILILYFIFAIVQPTRLKANKNYWANNNPSMTTIRKL